MKSSLWIFLLIAVMLSGCVSGDTESGAEDQVLSGEIKIAGSSTVYPIAQAMAEEFSKLHPEVNIVVSSTGTGGGFSNFFIPGNSDINNASRLIKDSELEQLRANEIEPIQLKVGIDALSMVVNKNADWVDHLTFDQLKRIWGPDNPPKKWHDVSPDWPDEKFELYGPAATSGTFDFFTVNVIGQEDQHRSDYHKTEHDNVIVQGIEGNKFALGYFGFAYYAQNEDRLKALAIDEGDGPVLPSLENARSNKYPLSRPLYIYVNKQVLEKPHIKEFVEYFIRQSATSLVSDVGYAPITDAMLQENLAKLK